jgi:hypothetical protein
MSSPLKAPVVALTGITRGASPEAEPPLAR